MQRTRGVGTPGPDENFEAIYLDDQGGEQRVPWGWLPEVVDELDRPVRAFPSYRGQRQLADHSLDAAGRAAAFGATFWWVLGLTLLASLPALLLPASRPQTRPRPVDQPS